MKKITVIGNAIVDVIAAPIDKNIFEQESYLQTQSNLPSEETH